MTLTEAPAEAASIEAVIKYVPLGTRAVFYPTDRARSSWPIDDHRLTVRDMRPVAGQLSLEQNGFVLLNEPTTVTNFYDPEEVTRVYIPEIKALVKRLTGAAEVLVFGEVVRSDGAGTPDGRQPSFGAHVDYGDRTVRDMIQRFAGEEAAARWLMGRYMLMNLWRPIKTVERTPLALCDASTVSSDDLNESEIRGGLNDPNRPSMFGFNLSYNPRHRWYYAPRMQPDEILAFKLFDSESDRIQWTGHTAFEDPTSRPDMPARESIEIRTISLFGP